MNRRQRGKGKRNGRKMMMIGKPGKKNRKYRLKWR